MRGDFYDGYDPTRVNHGAESYMERTYGLVPQQTPAHDGTLVCYTHDYQDPGDGDTETCAACGCKRRVNMEM